MKMAYINLINNHTALTSMIINHLNSAGTLRGGAIFALADAVFSAASNSRGTLAMVVNVSSVEKSS